MAWGHHLLHRPPPSIPLGPSPLLPPLLPATTTRYPTPTPLPGYRERLWGGPLQPSHPQEVPLGRQAGGLGNRLFSCGVVTCGEALGGNGFPHRDACFSHAERPILFSGLGPLNNCGAFCPLHWDTSLRCVEAWKDFPTQRCAFSQGGVFSHVQGEVFFLPPWTHVGPLKEFLRGFVSQNHVPSCLLPSPPSPLPHGDPGNGVFTYRDPWPPDNPGWYLGSIEEITASRPPSHCPVCPGKACLAPLAQAR